MPTQTKHSEHFDEVKAQTIEAYCDCNEFMNGNDNWETISKRRNLKFKSSFTVSRDESFDIMVLALGGTEEDNGYNEFTAQLILDHFPKNAKFFLAREGSVCLYASGKNLPKRIADEEDKRIIDKKAYTRFWWD